MKYAIYGANRVAKDFFYMFRELDIVCCYAAEGEDTAVFAAGTGRICKPQADLAAGRSEVDVIIVCDFPGATKKAKIAYLESLGLTYGKDYQVEEDFFDVFDEEKLNLAKKQIFIWGCGRKGEMFYHWNARREHPYIEFLHFSTCIQRMSASSAVMMSSTPRTGLRKITRSLS